MALATRTEPGYERRRGTRRWVVLAVVAAAGAAAVAGTAAARKRSARPETRAEEAVENKSDPAERTAAGAA